MGLARLNEVQVEAFMNEAWQEALRRSEQHDTWPADYEYINHETGKPYVAHHDAEEHGVYADGPRHVILRGGEGSGKTTAGAIKALDRIRRGMDGAVIAPDFPHFKRSTWLEFRRWIPWQFVVEKHQRMRSVEWVPGSQFQLVFTTGASVLLGGIEREGSWEGPNLSWVWFDEARHKKDAAAWKVLNGRIRIPGPDGEPPQMWITTTPRKNWLYDLFGPLKDDDDYAAVKERLLDIVLLTKDNVINLDAGYYEDRAAGLSSAEERALLEGQWEDIDNPDKFLDSILWWDRCAEQLPPLSPHEPMILMADAGVSNDCFGLVGVTRHPDQARRTTDIAVRHVDVWEPKGEKLDFDVQEERIRWLCENYNVVQIGYDNYQLHQMMTRLAKDGVAWVKEFGQGAPRLIADKQLLDLIIRRGIAHDGNPKLREHMDNADKKPDPEHRKLRIVKRTDRQKIDLVVATSMAANECLRLAI